MAAFLTQRAASGTSFLRGQALKFLHDFLPDDFNKTSLDTISLIPWNDEHAALVIRLVGKLSMHQKVPELQQTAKGSWIESAPVALHHQPPMGRSPGPGSDGRRRQPQAGCSTGPGRKPTLFPEPPCFSKDLAYTRTQGAFDLL